MKKIWIYLGLMGINSSVLADVSSKIEVVEESLKTETRMFCSKLSEKDALARCDAWLAQQRKTLGDRLMTSYCSHGELKSTNSSCLYRSMGELKFVLKTYKTETINK